MRYVWITMIIVDKKINYCNLPSTSRRHETMEIRYDPASPVILMIMRIKCNADTVKFKFVHSL